MLAVSAVLIRWRSHVAEIDCMVDVYQYGIVAGTGSIRNVEKLGGGQHGNN